MELTGADLPMWEYAVAKMAFKSHWLGCVAFALDRRRACPTDTLSPARNTTDRFHIRPKAVRRSTSAADSLTAALMARLARTNSIRCAMLWNILRCRR
jgi:hypothetical protein